MIVENNKQLKKFLKDFKSKESIILPIEQDSNLHPQKSKLSLLYVNTFDDEYVLPINHNECLNIDLPNLKTKNKVYTLDRKKLLHFLDLDNVIDVSMMSYMRTGKVLELDNLSTNAHDFLNMKFYKKKNINTVIPVLKHIEKCRKISTMLQNSIEKYSEYVNVSYNDEILNNLSFIEKNGLMTTEGKVFSEYNLYTSTGRPSNRFGGINFAALNKKDGSRKKFISRFKNGVLVEMDFDAYHLRLIADKIGYDLPKGSVHEHMAQFYGVDYEEAKRLSFQYLYGFIPEDVIQINPYFSKVHDYIEGLWNIYKNDDFVESDIYKRRIYKENLLDMNANKLFNYTIQLMETENNMKDGLGYLKKVKDVLEQDGKYPVKVSWGLNYHEMKDITRKFV